MNPQEQGARDDWLRRIATGEVRMHDPDLQKAMAADARLRAEAEALDADLRQLDAAGAEERDSMAAAERLPPSGDVVARTLARLAAAEPERPVRRFRAWQVALAAAGVAIATWLAIDSRPPRPVDPDRPLSAGRHVTGLQAEWQGAERLLLSWRSDLDAATYVVSILAQDDPTRTPVCTEETKETRCEFAAEDLRRVTADRRWSWQVTASRRGSLLETTTVELPSR